MADVLADLKERLDQLTDDERTEIVDYLLPSETNIRRVDVDKSVSPSQLWVGNNHKATLVRVEPLEP